MPTQQIVPILLTHCRFSFSGSMMNRMSFSETIFLFFLALIIFGPKKLPEIARQVGKALNEFKRASNEFKAQIEQEISNLEVENRQTILPPSPTPEGATSRKLYAAPVEAGPADAQPAGALATAVPGTEVPTTETPTTEARTTEARTTQAAADDEPLFAAGAGVGSPESSPAATEAVSSPAIASSDGVTAPTSQESHV